MIVYISLLSTYSRVSASTWFSNISIDYLKIFGYLLLTWATFASCSRHGRLK